MRFIAKVTMDNEAGNALIRDKEMQQKMEAIFSDVRPEEVYFGVDNGQRTLFCVVNLEGNHEIPRVAEPFWLALKANVEFIPVMNQADFKKAAKDIDSAGRKYNW